MGRWFFLRIVAQQEETCVPVLWCFSACIGGWFGIYVVHCFWTWCWTQVHAPGLNWQNNLSIAQKALFWVGSFNRQKCFGFPLVISWTDWSLPHCQAGQWRCWVDTNSWGEPVLHSPGVHSVETLCNGLSSPCLSSRWVFFKPFVFLKLHTSTCKLWGVYPDLLHIMDLQICHDVISSCLLELTDSTSAPRDHQLRKLSDEYEQWCKQQGDMAEALPSQIRNDISWHCLNVAVPFPLLCCCLCAKSQACLLDAGQIESCSLPRLWLVEVLPPIAHCLKEFWKVLLHEWWCPGCAQLAQLAAKHQTTIGTFALMGQTLCCWLWYGIFVLETWSTPTDKPLSIVLLEGFDVRLIFQGVEFRRSPILTTLKGLIQHCKRSQG